jgi:hypothetical protein
MTLGRWMIVVAIVATWLFIVAQGIAYQRRHVEPHSAWDQPE